MKQGRDIAVEFPGVLIIHQNIRAREVANHEHAEHEFFLPLYGEIKIVVRGQALRAGPGKMIYLPAGTAHTFTSPASGGGERLIFLVSKDLWKKREAGEFGAAVFSVNQLAKELLFYLLLNPRTRAASSLIDTLILTLSEALASAGEQGAPGLEHLESRSTDVRVGKSLRWMRKNFASAAEMPEIAKWSGMSVRNFNRLFLKEMGMTPKQALTLYRIEFARKMLAERQRSVTDVALAAGYQSLSQFIATFRRVTGKLPSDIKG